MDFSIQTFKTGGERALLDPRTSILAIVVIGAIMIGGKLSGVEYVLRVISCMIPAVLLFVIKKYKTATVYFLFMAITMILEGTAVQITSGSLNLVFVIISGVVSRFIPQFMMAYCFLSYTTVSEFIVSMEKMRAPSFITIPMSVMFRFFPTISEEGRCVMEAMKMRKTSKKKPSLTQKLEYELVPVMMQTVRISDELSQAAMTKGLGLNTRRTHICKVGFRLIDYVMIIVLLTCLALFIIF